MGLPSTILQPRPSAPGVRLMIDDGEEREGAERRDGASRGASDHRGMERGQQCRSVRSQNRSEHFPYGPQYAEPLRPQLDQGNQ